MNDEPTVIAEKTFRFACGTPFHVRVQKERGSWYLVTDGYSVRHATKKAALAALETHM